MTDHEMILLRAAVEACPSDRCLMVGADWCAHRDLEDNLDVARFYAPGHLTALLRDLGADVPEWPSAERMAEIRSQLKRQEPGGHRDQRTYLDSLPLPEYLALRGGS